MEEGLPMNRRLRCFSKISAAKCTLLKDKNPRPNVKTSQNMGPIKTLIFNELVLVFR